MPDSAKAASRWAREAEFLGSRMWRMSARSAGSMRGRAARGSSAPTASTQGSSMTGRSSMPRTGPPMVIQARSRSSQARASRQLRIEFSVWNSRITSGWRRRKVTTASDMKCRTVVAPVVTRTVPPPPRTRSSTRRRAPSSPAMPSAAAPWRMRPASVGTTPRAWRSRRLAPVCFSRRRTCWLTADWVQPRSRATALRLPARQTATNTRRSSRVMRPKLSLGGGEQIGGLTWVLDGLKIDAGPGRQPVPARATGSGTQARTGPGVDPPGPPPSTGGTRRCRTTPSHGCGRSEHRRSPIRAGPSSHTSNASRSSSVPGGAARAPTSGPVPRVLRYGRFPHRLAAARPAGRTGRGDRRRGRGDRVPVRRLRPGGFVSDARRRGGGLPGPVHRPRALPAPGLRRDLAELSAANELDLARIDPAFREAWGAELLALFTRLCGLLSEPARRECRAVLGDLEG